MNKLLAFSISVLLSIPNVSFGNDKPRDPHIEKLMKNRDKREAYQQKFMSKNDSDQNTSQTANRKLSQEEVEEMLDTAPQDVKDLLDNLMYKKRFFMNKPPHFIVFVGPSGNGKTTTAKAFAMKLGTDYTYIKSPEELSQYVNGTSVKLISRIKSILRLQKPHVIILDEFDVFYKRSDNEINPDHETKLALSTMIDQCEEIPGVMLIGTTNDLSGLPEQIRTRVDGNVIKFSMPDASARKRMLIYTMKLHDKRKEQNECELVLNNERALDYLVKKTKNFSAREIERLIKRAHRHAARRIPFDQPLKINLEDFDAAFGNKKTTNNETKKNGPGVFKTTLKEPIVQQGLLRLAIFLGKFSINELCKYKYGKPCFDTNFKIPTSDDSSSSETA